MSEPWVRYTIWCRCGRMCMGTTPKLICTYCEKENIDYVQKHTLPDVFCDTRVAQVLRWLMRRDNQHTYLGAVWEGVSHVEFMKKYADAGEYQQRDSSHWRRFHDWLIARDQPYGNSRMRVRYLGPPPGEWYDQLTDKKKQLALRWVESVMETNEEESEFWFKLMKERGIA